MLRLQSMSERWSRYWSNQGSLFVKALVALATRSFTANHQLTWKLHPPLSLEVVRGPLHMHMQWSTSCHLKSLEVVTWSFLLLRSWAFKCGYSILMRSWVAWRGLLAVKGRLLLLGGIARKWLEHPVLTVMVPSPTAGGRIPINYMDFESNKD